MAAVPKVFKAFFKDQALFIEDKDDAKQLYQSGFYGEMAEDGRLLLNDVEGLYLLDLGRINVFNDRGEPLSFQELIERLHRKDANIWDKFLIYSDLRKRGLTVKPGFRSLEFRVYRRGAVVGQEAAKYIIDGVREGADINISELSDIVREARSSRKELILAVIDGQGEVTYYEVSQITL